MTTSLSSGSSAGSRRFWITVLCFFLANLAAWYGYHRWEASRLPRRDILTVDRFAPGDNAVVRDPQPVLAWTFNLDAGKPGPVVAGAGEGAPGVLVPAVKGQWSWVDARTLSFEPSERLARATRYTVKLNHVVSAEGFTLAADPERHFSTEGLRLTAVRQVAFDGQQRLLLELEFNDKVIPGEVLRHLEISCAGRPVHATLQGEGAGEVVRVLTEAVDFSSTGSGTVTPALPTLRFGASPSQEAAGTLRVELTPGLTGMSGPLGLTDVVTREVRVAQVLLADSMEGGEDGRLVISFNNPLSAESFEALKPLLTVDPPVEFKAAMNYSMRNLDLTGPFVAGTRYTVRINKAVAGVDQQKLPQATVLSAVIPDRSPSVSFADNSGFLGSKGNRSVLVRAVNMPAFRIRAQRVYENNLVEWRNRAYDEGDSSAPDYARPLASRRYDCGGPKNQTREVRVNLDELLGPGNAVEGAYRLELAADAEAGGATDETGNRQFWQNSRYESTRCMVTLSDIGLTAKLMASPGHAGTEQALLAWALSLSTGQPQAGVQVRAFTNKNQLLGEGMTDAQGLVQIDHLNPAPEESPAVIVASRQEAGGAAAGAGGGLTWLDLTKMQRGESGFATNGRAYLRSGYEAFIWSERGVYRPGENVVLRAIVRGPGITVPADKLPIRWQMRRPDGRDWMAQPARLDGDGAAEWQLTIPADAPTGYWTVQLGLPGDPAAGSAGMQIFGMADFQVEEFVPNRIKTALTLDGAAPRAVIGDKPLTAQLQADYLFGQPAAHLQSVLNVRLSPAVFACEAFPAGQGWQSGDAGNVAEALGGARPAPVRLDAVTMELDAAGHGKFEVDLQHALAAGQDGAHPAEAYAFHGPWHVGLSDDTTEVGGRAVTAYAAIEADALPYYIMVRRGGSALAGQSAAFEIRLVTPAGAPAAVDKPLEAQVFRESWNSSLQRVSGRYTYQSTRVLEPVGEKVSVAVGGGAGAFAWKPAEPGAYVVEFSDGTQFASMPVYVSDPAWGGGWADTVSREHPEQLDVQLVTPEVAGGDKARPLYHEGQAVTARIRSPFAGRLLLTIETDTVLLSKVVEMTQNTAEVPVELPAGLWPNGYVSAQVVRAIDTGKEWGAHRAFGMARFAIDPADQRLNIKIAAPAEMRPQRTLDIDLAVTDARGASVANAAVALAAVDEGILNLTYYTTPQPLAYFASTRALGVETSDVYSRLMPEVQKLDGIGTVGGDEDSTGFVHRHSSPVAAKRVKPVALVSAIVHTDAAGKATAHLQVPEFLGQLRIMVVGYTGAGSRGLGSAEGRVLVRSPLVVESSFPRFLAPGDRCQVPLVVINNSAFSGEATVRLTSDSGALLTIDVPERRMALAPNQQATVMFDLTAQQAAGVARVTVEATLGGERYTEHVEIPIRPPSPAVTAGAALTVAGEKPLTLEAPAMLKGTESFELRIGQRPALNLPQGLAYLDHYPYGCLEQTTSQCFPLVYLPDIGKQMAPGVFDQERIGRKVESGIIRMIGMQTASGGLSMWPGQTEDWAWGSVYAAHFLAEAAHAGYKVPADFQARLDAYLHSLLTKSTTDVETAEVQAYAAYVLALEGSPNRTMMNRLGEFFAQEQARKDGMDLSQAQLHLALAWAASGRKDLAEKLLPQQLPVPRTTRQLGGNVGSPVRDQALLIMTLLTVSPDHPALPNLVEKLYAQGGDRGWLSTQDNAFAVLALGKYLRATGGEAAFERAELLQGDTPLGAAVGDKPLVWSPVAGAGRDGLRVRVSGPAGAKASVSWLETGVPVAMPADADHALKVRRQYQHEDGTALAADERVLTGTTLRVEITVESATSLSNVVLEDLLPAGLEAENPRLATAHRDEGAAPTTSMPAGKPRPLSWSRLDVRDDRVITMGTVPAGSNTWSYVVRAVTPGTYVVPPVRGECMYDPGINSMSGGGAHLTVASRDTNPVAAP